MASLVACRGDVAADKYLVGGQPHEVRDFAPADDGRIGRALSGDGPFLTDVGGEPDYCRFARLPMNLGEEDVGRRGDEETMSFDWRQLCGVAEHEDRSPERHQVARKLLVDH
jgi:hypothetical protein